MEFGQYAVQNVRRKGEKRPTFTFLGFTHYCGHTRNGHFKVKRCTSMKKFKAKLQDYTEWIRKSWSIFPTDELVFRAKSRIQGHLNYYAITDNSEMCASFLYWFTNITFNWLNRRSQRSSYNWTTFSQMLETI